MRTDDIEVVAPGRVCIIGDHTDYTGGLCLPMAIDLETRIVANPIPDRVDLVSDAEPEPAIVALDVDLLTRVQPYWAKYVAAVVQAVKPANGLQGKVTTTIPLGAGLSSSAAFEVALALALGFEGGPVDIARLCQGAEQAATGVPTGILDQLASTAGKAGFGMVLDCTTLGITYVPIPDEVEMVVIHSGQGRQLAASGYSERVQQCRAAEAVVGPLCNATLGQLDSIEDPVLRRRARHVVTENQRVRDFSVAMGHGDVVAGGRLMDESHESLQHDYESSHPTVDALISRLRTTNGVLGSRVTGGGFGGCVVAMTRPGALGAEGWHVKPAQGARRI